MKPRLLYGVCIMILVSLVACGSDNGLYSMESESTLAIESSSKSMDGDERTKIDIENSHNETLGSKNTDESALQTNKESEMPTENKSSVASIENSYNETVETKNENSLQVVYSATIEKQVYLPEEENLSTNVLDAEGLYVFLSGLSYNNETCDGLPEYIIHFDDGSQYYVNITEGWIWRGNNKEAKLTGEEMELINSFIQ